MVVGKLNNNQEIELKLEIIDEKESEEIYKYLQSINSNKSKQVIQHIKMKAIYYDTTDGFYERNRIAYRVRQENDCLVATYKEGKINEQGVFERLEINKNVNSLEPNIEIFSKEEKIWNKIKKSKDKTFVPVVITDFVRDCINLIWGKSVIELALDRGLIKAGDKQVPICELELELKKGDIKDLIELKQELEKMFKLQASTISKYKRGLILLGK